MSGIRPVRPSSAEGRTATREASTTWDYQTAPWTDPSVRGQRAIQRDRSDKKARLRHICRHRRRSDKTLETRSTTTTTQSPKKLGLRHIRCPRRRSEKTSEARLTTTTTQSPKRNSNDESTRSAH